MVQDVASRSVLTGLHILGGLSAGGSLLAVLLQWVQDIEQCLPPISTSPLADTVMGRLCDILTYGNGVVCLLSFFMAITINCCWRHWFWFYMHQIFTLLMLLVTACCATGLTMDFILWCDSIMQSQPGYRYRTCESVANMNVTTAEYFRKMQIQQGCEWAAVPVLLTAVIIYTGIMHMADYTPIPPSQHRRSHPSRPVAQYSAYHDYTETAPLVFNSDSAVTDCAGEHYTATGEGRSSHFIGDTHHRGRFTSRPASYTQYDNRMTSGIASTPPSANPLHVSTTPTVGSTVLHVGNSSHVDGTEP